MISTELINNEIYSKLYLSRSDIKDFLELFSDKFNICILKYPELATYYNQNNIKTNTESISKLCDEFEQFKLAYSKRIRNPELITLLDSSFKKERDFNPSIKNALFFEELLPHGIFPEYPITATVNKEENHIPIKEFFEKVWNSTEQNHISITGIGGIGKTVTLFNLKYPAPTIYIPLRDLSASQDAYNVDFITKYIKEVTLNSTDGAFDALIQLCNEPWINKPNIILLLDGLNEVTQAKLNSIIREISTTWAKKQGLQIILTSRYDVNTKLQLNNIHQVLLEPLSRDIISNHLLNNNIRLPISTDRVWEIIDTPLMLILYTRCELIRKSHKNQFANWRDAKNGGSIIWNFLQSELHQTKFHNPLESVATIHFYAPFICYKMMLNNDFTITQSDFRNIISEATNIYNQSLENGTLPTIITIAIDDNGNTNIDKQHIFNLLIKNFNIFKQRSDTIQLVHHHFRDCLAAIHIIQVADNAITIPNEWISNFDPYVTDFICDLLSTEKPTQNCNNSWKKIWNFKYQKEGNTQQFINKMLNIYKKTYGSDISSIDFSDVDLTKTSLNMFKLTKDSNNHFSNTKIGNETFWGTGHSDTVSATSWGVNDKYYISASHDCTIRIYDSSNTPKVLSGAHSHYIRCASCSPVNENVIASAGDDQQLIIWTCTRETSSTGEVQENWSTEIWGKCNNWIRSMQWDRSGQKIICGDGNGEIRLFDGCSAVDFEHKHKTNVRHLTWLEHKSIVTIASGDDDGLFCIWNINGKCIFEKKLNNPITAISWLQNGKYLMVSTSEKIHFYKVNFKGQTNDSDILVSLIKEWNRNKISYITSRCKDTIDYVAIFEDINLSIFCISDIDGKLQFDELGSYQYNSETNKIITAEWNLHCDKLICGSRDGSVSFIDVVRSEENKQRIIFNIVGRRCNKAARCSSWSPNGKLLAVGYDDCAIRIWDPFKERCLAVLKSHFDSVKSVYWSPDSCSLVSGSDDNEVKIWTGSDLSRMKATSVFKHEGPVNAVVWLKNNTIISASDDKSIAFINTNCLENPVVKRKHSDRVYSLAISPDGDYMISGGNDNYILMWNLETLSCYKYNSGHPLPIRSIAWSSNQKHIITSSNDCTINLRIFNSDKNKICNEIYKFPKIHDDFIYGANLSKNEFYAIGGSTDSTVGFWRMPNRNFVFKSTEHTGFVWNVSSSPQISGKYFVSTSSSDGTVKIWDVSDKTRESFKPSFNLPVIPETDIIGCDFSGANIEDITLKQLIIANGGIIN